MSIKSKKLNLKKTHRGTLKSFSNKNKYLIWGNWGLKSIETKIIGQKEVLSAKQTLTRFIKKYSTVFVKVLFNKTYTKRTSESRMGSGKGSIFSRNSIIYKDQILFELNTVDNYWAFLALSKASKKLSIKTKIIHKKYLNDII
uniref:Ribosomal protein L16 n=1 Tax=Piridium sociabile TaxID=2570542 RepID=A0A5B9XW54_9ALVE|nr:ribosomal protein L16 [Piridium sociabile]